MQVSEMASIHRDPRSHKGVWYCSYTLADGRRVMRSTGTTIRTQARIICESWAETERAAREGSLSTSRAAEIINETLERCGHEPLTRYRLGQWFSEFLEARSDQEAGKRSVFAQAKFLAFLGSGAEQRFLDSISAVHIRNFARELSEEGRCATTVNRIVRIDLGSVFARAVRLGLLRFNPVEGVEPLKEKDILEERKTFTPEQIAKIVKTAHGSDWEGAVLFGYTTGARLQDVANLRWSAIDLENGVVVFRQRKTAHKSGRQTVVGLHPDFLDWLLEHQSAPDDPLAFVFPTLANRSAGGKNGLSAQFNKLLKAAGIDAGLLRQRHGVSGRSRRNLSFHSLRHTSASSVFNAAAVKEVARRLTDHAPNGSLDRYLHIDLSAIRSATALIPRLPL
jgi:integrase